MLFERHLLHSHVQVQQKTSRIEKKQREFRAHWNAIRDRPPFALMRSLIP